MTLIDFLILLLVAGICGAVGRAITGYSSGGWLAAIATGFIGALIGIWLARLFALPELLPVWVGATRFPVIWAILGSALFVALIGMFSRRRF